MVELEEWCKEVGRPTTDVKMLRIDQLAELGCCCFCSIRTSLCSCPQRPRLTCLAVYIANEAFLARESKKAAAFMRAVHKAAAFLKANPAQAWTEYKAFKKTMDTLVNAKIFERSFVYMSVDCRNVERDWIKVTNVSSRSFARECHKLTRFCVAVLQAPRYPRG